MSVKPPPRDRQHVTDVKHFKRFPTGGTVYAKPHETSDADDYVKRVTDVMPVPTQQSVRSSSDAWFRRFPNGGTTYVSAGDEGGENGDK